MFELIHSHCLSAAVSAERMGLGHDVCEVLPQAFERWDGRGLPAGLTGHQLSPAIRIVHIADIVEVHHRMGGSHRRDPFRDRARPDRPVPTLKRA